METGPQRVRESECSNAPEIASNLGGYAILPLTRGVNAHRPWDRRANGGKR